MHARSNRVTALGIALALGVAASPAFASDTDPLAAPMSAAPTVGEAPSGNIAAIVADAKTVNRLGALNYCYESFNVDGAQALTVLTAKNGPTNAVVQDESGNMDYAYGSASILESKGKLISLDKAEPKVQQSACGAILASLQTAS